MKKKALASSYSAALRDTGLSVLDKKHDKKRKCPIQGLEAQLASLANSLQQEQQAKQAEHEAQLVGR